MAVAAAAWCMYGTLGKQITPTPTKTALNPPMRANAPFNVSHRRLSDWFENVESAIKSALMLTSVGCETLVTSWNSSRGTCMTWHSSHELSNGCEQFRVSGVIPHRCYAGAELYSQACHTRASPDQLNALDVRIGHLAHFATTASPCAWNNARCLTDVCA